MSIPNLYWPVYKNLEKEFLDLANYIHISDDQTDIYSMHIADLTYAVLLKSKLYRKNYIILLVAT